MRLALAVALIAGLATPAWGQTQSLSARPDGTTLVIYRFNPIDTSSTLDELRSATRHVSTDGLAMIVESRTVDVPAGEAILRFEGLTPGIIPESAAIDGLPGEVLERNSSFELLTAGSLLQHSIGETVQVGRTNPETGVETVVPAIVRSGANGPVLEIDGRLEPLSCQGLNQRLIFDRVPDGLGDRPTLSVRTRSPVAGRYTIRLAYLAEGLNWSADYVARLAPDGRSMDIEGWITLMNFTNGGFTDTPVQVVAGNLAREYDTEAIEPVVATVAPRCWPLDTTTRNPFGPQRGTIVPTPVTDYLATIPALSNSVVGDTGIDEIVVTGSRIRATLSDLGDYKIYTLAEPTDLNARQAKQIRFFDQQDVRFTRTYQVRLDHSDDAPQVPKLLLRLRNEARDGLGVPMPGGGLSLIETHDGAAILTGQADFMDRGEGVPLELEFGEAMGLSVLAEVTDEADWKAGEDTYMQKVVVEATLINDKDWPVEIEVVPEWSGWRGFRVLAQSRRCQVNDAGDTVWRVRVPARGSETLSYTVQAED
ncbi:DUF4139 domain-containing protein [Brevundimonas sp. M20]|uniref:DUF4139 domain-containing protein n=1 Tax=Brevundimonas sp. M20 TaxID=2591463 RepID=UPI0011461BC2|nr:hypothetical protein [Brevundimonas sp. M20]QDH74102.1 hypothetical protein FKQ52_12140 [Brevundimonas sp. M20]